MDRRILFEPHLLSGNNFFKIQLTERSGNTHRVTFIPLLEKDFPTDIKKHMHAAYILSAFESKMLKTKRAIAVIEAGKSKDQKSANKAVKADSELIRLLFSPLLKYNHIYRFLHRIKTDNNQFRTEACSFLEIKELVFKVVSLDEGLWLNTYIKSEVGTMIGLDEAEWIPPLLRYRNTYFVPDEKQFASLQLVIGADKKFYSKNKDQFINRILKVLEKRHTVRRGTHFDPIVIESEPVNMLYISEISNSFLMITPRWQYGQFVIEDYKQTQNEFWLDGSLYKIERHIEKEKEFRQQVMILHPLFKEQAFSSYFYLDYAAAQKKNWFYNTYLQLLDENVVFSGMDLLQHFRFSEHPIETIMIDVLHDDMHIIIKMQVYFGDERIDLKRLQQLLRSDQEFYLLKNQTLGVITREWKRQYFSLFKQAIIRDETLYLPKWWVISESDDLPDERFRLAIKEDWWTDWKKWQTSDSALLTLPSSLHAELRPYQQKGLEWLMLLARVGAGACLADDMGLGKTVQTIAFMSCIMEQAPRSRFLIIAPVTLMYNWLREIQKFNPSLKAAIYHGHQRDRDILENKDIHVVVSSFGVLRSDIEDLESIIWNAVIIDESQNIKNPQAQTTRAAYRLNAYFRLCLSGTPIMNDTMDLFGQTQFFLPEFLGSLENFRKQYATPIDKNRNEEVRGALKKLINPFFLRRTKQKVAQDLPEKTESVLWCRMNAKQQSVYEEIRKKAGNEVRHIISADGFAASKMNILVWLMRLRQACCSPVLIGEEYRDETDSIKLDMLMDELVPLVQNSKAVVFSQFTGMLRLIQETCHRSKISTLYIDGSVSASERDRIVNTFQDQESEEKVLLLSLKAGNTGLNLTAASYVFLVDPWWNAAVERQAIDRIFRIGQDKNVFAYKLICQDTIEEKILHMQENKSEVAEDLLQVDESFVKNLTQEDLNYLLS